MLKRVTRAPGGVRTWHPPRPRNAVAALLTLVVAALAPTARAGVTANDLVLVVNKQQPAGRELAEAYAKLRGVPADRLIEIDVPDNVEIARAFYDSSIAKVIRDQLTARQLRTPQTCLVLFYGVPLRVREQERTPLERTEVTALLDPMIAALRGRLKTSTEQLETIARELDATYRPSPAGEGTDQLRQRIINAEKSVEASIAKLGNPVERGTVQQRVRDVQSLLTTMPRLDGLPATRPTTPPTQAQVTAWLAASDDVEARRSLREAIYFGGNVFQMLMLTEAQKRTLTGVESESSVDSELSLLLINNYPLARWLPNPFHHGGQGKELLAGSVRVARIDGPTPEVARRIFTNAAEVEQTGLRGDAVLDARGLSGPGGIGSYEGCDQSIRNTAKYLGGSESLKTVFDNNGPLLPDGTSDRAAIYCGWYQVRKYTPTCKYVPGSVAYHVASYEMLALRPAMEQGWCRGLLMDGADVTLGPVGEPYVVAFPPPDEFYGLLLTGRPTLVEAYWSTVPITSWKMVLIGDPLYRPFAKNPVVTVDQLPVSLRTAAGG